MDKEKGIALRIKVCAAVTAALLLFAILYVSTHTGTKENISRESSLAKEPLTGDEIAATMETNAPDKASSEPTAQASVLDVMIENGEITGYCRGNTANIVYKITPSTFDTPEQCQLWIVDNDGNCTSEVITNTDEFYHGEGSLANLVRNLNAGKEFNHIGNDIFWQKSEFDFQRTIYIFNAKTLEINLLNDYLDVQKKLREGFHDGLIITPPWIDTNSSYNAYNVSLLNDSGAVLTKSIKANRFYSYDEYKMGIGPYKEGLFYGYGNFYDSQGNCAIDLSEYIIKNVPEFENGSAYLEIWRNEKTWGVYIDKSGEFIGDPVEIVN